VKICDDLQVYLLKFWRVLKMDYTALLKPNLPEKNVKLVVADGRISEGIRKKLAGMGIKLVCTRKHAMLYEAVSCHPDMVICHTGGYDLVCAPGTEREFLNELAAWGFNLIMGETCPGNRYPHNIAYNVAIAGGLAFHNTKYTDPVLKRELMKKGIEFVHVNQGYTKCSVSVVDKNCIITGDRGILKAAERKGLDVILLEDETAIKLPGLDHGFIGGASCLLGPKCWALTGNVETLKGAGKILQRLAEKGMSVVSLSSGEITDVGSLLPLLEN